MTPSDTTGEQALVARIESLLGRPMRDDEVRLAKALQADKSPELIARELEGAPITDPKKIRPEHKDTADE